MPKLWKYILIFLLSANILVFTAFFSFSNDRLHVVFCDVGQGDAALIFQKTTQILIDGGPDSSVLSCLSAHMPFWDREIEAIFLSHAETDHFTGFIDVVKRYKVDHFITSGVGKDTQAYKALVDALKNNKVQIDIVHEGEVVRSQGLAFNILWPREQYIARDFPNLSADKAGIKNDVLGAKTSNSLNGYSLILRLSYGQFSALFTGDIEPPEEDDASEHVRPVTVLKVPHHGSKNGLDQKLLEAVSPKLAVISVGKNNRYGHPHKETLDLLKRWNVRMLRTDQDGEVEVVTDGGRWWVK